MVEQDPLFPVPGKLYADAGDPKPLHRRCSAASRFVRHIHNDLDGIGTGGQIFVAEVLQDIVREAKSKQLCLDRFQPAVFCGMLHRPRHGIFAAKQIAAHAPDQQTGHDGKEDTAVSDPNGGRLDHIVCFDQTTRCFIELVNENDIPDKHAQREDQHIPLKEGEQTNQSVPHDQGKCAACMGRKPCLLLGVQKPAPKADKQSQQEQEVRDRQSRSERSGIRHNA